MTQQNQRGFREQGYDASLMYETKLESFIMLYAPGGNYGEREMHGMCLYKPICEHDFSTSRYLDNTFFTKSD